MITWYRYVRHADLVRALIDGWRWCADLGQPHGEYSCLMEWAGDGEPPGAEGGSDGEGA